MFEQILPRLTSLRTAGRIGWLSPGSANALHKHPAKAGRGGVLYNHQRHIVHLLLAAGRVHALYLRLK